MNGWRTALRIARREAWRARGRSILVIVMIALPVAFMVFLAIGERTFRLTPDEQADRLMGTGQARIAWQSDGPVIQDPAETAAFPAGGLASVPVANPQDPTTERLLALLPPGTRAIPDRSGRLNVHTAAGTAALATRALNYTDALARGILRPLSGRAPSAADEVAVTPAAAQRLGAGLGGTVRPTDGTRAYRIVGTVEDPSDLRATTILLPPGSPPVAGTGRHDLAWLVATPGPVTWAQVKELNTHGVTAVSREVLRHPPSQAERYAEFGMETDPELAFLVLVGGLAVLEMVLLAGPAFAVSARRRQRDLALVAAAGGTPAQVRRIVLADGVVLGVVAATAGLVLGIAAAAATRPLIEEHLSHVRSGAFRVFPIALAVLAGVAVVTGLLAALVPAWISSRQDVVTALSGRRGITRSRRRWAVLGVVLIAAGAVLAAAGALKVNPTTIMVGVVVGELGLVLCTPAILGLVSRLGGRLPLTARMALRHTARNRTAAAPAISAVIAAVVGSLAAGVVLAANDARTHDNYRTLSRPGDVALYSGGKTGVASGNARAPQTVAAVRSILAVDQIADVSLLSCGSGDCFVKLRLPEAFACPYEPWFLDLTAAEQRAARRDTRCEGVGRETEYFGGITSIAGVIVVIDAAGAGAVAHLPAGDVDQVTAALRAGKVVVDDPHYVEHDQVTFLVTEGKPGAQPARAVTAPGFVLPHRPTVPIVMLTEATARSLGFAAAPFATMVTTTRMPTVQERDRLQAALGIGFNVQVERGPRSNSATLVVLAVVAGLITLVAAAVATGLAAADGRADLTTLAAVGASPRVRRMLSLSQSGVIAGLGSLIGTAAGLGAAIAVLAALNRSYADTWPAPAPYPITLPWLNIGVALVAVPAVAMLGAGLLTRSRLPIERRL